MKNKEEKPITTGGQTNNIMLEIDTQEVIETVNEKAQSVADVKPEGHKLWEFSKWKGLIDTWKCKKCGSFFNSKDDIITHVVGHAPRNEQSKLLDQLVKE
jgi:hypothetical protein